MEGGGAIIIHEEEGLREPYGSVVIIRVTDTGSGIQKPIQEKGLSTLFHHQGGRDGPGPEHRQQDHGKPWGELELISERGEGSTFVITLPIKES